MQSCGFTFDCAKKYMLDKEQAQQAEVLRALVDDPPAACDDTETLALLTARLHTELAAVGDGCAAAGVFRDVEMFDDLGGSGTLPAHRSARASAHRTVLDVFSGHASLSGGKDTLRVLLGAPTRDPACLRRRQDSLAKLGAEADVLVRMRASLTRMAAWEADVLWVTARPSEEVQALYDMAYFQSWLLRGLNLSPAALTCFAWQRIVASPLIGLLTPLVYVVLPYLVLRYNGLNVAFSAYVRMLFRSFSVAGALVTQGVAGGAWIRNLSMGFSVLFYFQSLFGSFEVARTLHAVCRIVATRIANVHAFIREACDINDALKAIDLDLAAAWGVRLPAELCANLPQDLPRTFSMFSNFGRALKAFRDFDGQDYMAALEWAYLVDAVAAVECTRHELGFCFPALATGGSVRLEADGLWHPCLPPSRAVPNDVALGERQNMLLTGPNAGGKSTLLKAVLIAALLAQSVGVAPCASLRMTPFAQIRSQINVPDCKGSQSLFEAEMLRCKASLDEVRHADAEGGTSLVVMDEIFSSTNVVEGIAGAFAVAKAFARCKGNVAIISTHFAYLTKLAKESTFENFRMQVDVSAEDGDISYPYKMTRGVSKQYIALELLRINGFDPDVLEEAMAVRTRLTRPSITTTTATPPADEVPPADQNANIPKV